MKNWMHYGMRDSIDNFLPLFIPYAPLVRAEVQL
jgi:hypothetical protein